MTKHYKEITLKSGRIVYGFNPSPTLRKKLGYKWKAYDTAEEAKARAHEAAEAFAEFKRSGDLPRTVAYYNVSGLIDAYKLTSRWRKIARVENSKRAYEQAMASIKSLIGSEAVSNIDPLYAEDLYERLCEQHSTNKANSVMTMLRIIFSNAQRLNLIAANPFSKLGLDAVPSRDVMWTDAQVKTFVECADQNGLASIGTLILIAYDLCQRPGDCRQMRWGNYKDGVFSFAQEKTRTPINIPATEILVKRLEAMRTNRNPEDAIVIYEGTGRPYSGRLYRKKAAAVRELAGLPDILKVSDLRRSGATLLGASSCSEDEIRAVTGHKSRQILSTYVKPDLRMAAAAQRKRSIELSQAGE